MANIYTDEHCLHTVHLLWQFQVEQVAAHLAVNLLQHVRCLREIEFSSISGGHDLGRNLVQLVKLLVLLVQALVTEDQDDHFWEAELPRTCHVELQFFLHGLNVCLVVKLDPMRFSNTEVELTRAFHKAFVNVVRSVVIATAVRVSFWSHVGHNPLLMPQIDRLLNWEAPHDILIDVDHLVLLENLGFWQDRLISQIDWIAVDGEVPIAEDLLVHEKADEAVDVAHLLLRVDAADGEAVSHAWTSSDAIRNTIDTAKLRRQVDHVVTVLDDDQRLIVVRDPFFIDVGHVLGDADLFVVINELFAHRSVVKVNVGDLISALVTPISNHAGSNDLLSD